MQIAFYFLAQSSHSKDNRAIVWIVSGLFSILKRIAVDCMKPMTVDCGWHVADLVLVIFVLFYLLNSKRNHSVGGWWQRTTTLFKILSIIVIHCVVVVLWCSWMCMVWFRCNPSSVKSIPTRSITVTFYNGKISSNAISITNTNDFIPHFHIVICLHLLCCIISWRNYNMKVDWIAWHVHGFLFYF